MYSHKTKQYQKYRLPAISANPFSAKSVLAKTVSAKKFKFLFHLIKLFLIHSHYQKSINNV